MHFNRNYIILKLIILKSKPYQIYFHNPVCSPSQCVPDWSQLCIYNQDSEKRKKKTYPKKLIILTHQTFLCTVGNIVRNPAILALFFIDYGPLIDLFSCSRAIHTHRIFIWYFLLEQINLTAQTLNIYFIWVKK